MTVKTSLFVMSSVGSVVIRTVGASPIIRHEMTTFPNLGTYSSVPRWEAVSKESIRSPERQKRRHIARGAVAAAPGIATPA